MKKFISLAFPVFMAVVLLIAACPLGAVAETPVSFTEEFTSADTFAEKWETVKTATGETLTQYMKREPGVSTSEDVISEALVPAHVQKAPNFNIATLVKDDYWPGNSTDNRLTSVTAELHITPDVGSWKAAQLALGYIDETNYFYVDFSLSATGYLYFRFNSVINGTSQSVTKFVNDTTGLYIGTEANGDFNGNITLTVDYDYSVLDAGTAYNIYPDITITNAAGVELTYRPNRASIKQGIIPATDATTGLPNVQPFTGAQKVGVGFSQIADAYFVDSFTCTFEKSAEAYIGTAQPEEPEVPEVPTVLGGTIKQSGTQDIQFTYTTGKVDESNPIVEYGMLLTLKAYGVEDLTLANEADIAAGKIKTASSGEVSITAPTSFTAAIGEVPEDLYTFTYVTRTYVKYEDGSIEYSDAIERSVSGIAKSIGKWVLDNEANITGLAGDIKTLVNADGTLTDAAKENNGAAILAYLTDNADAITAALNA